MVFCSSIFLFFFLPLCLMGYYLTPTKFRNYTLLLFSLLFYIWGETTYAWLILSSICFNYIWGIVIERSAQKRLTLLIGVFINVSVLFYYKYAGFFVNTLSIDTTYFKSLTLPLGISFYTFHSISYLVDIYRGKAKAQLNFPKMGLYIVNFAQLVAGPIIRYHDVETQLTTRKHIWNRLRNGSKLFIYGLSKKMIIANTVGLMADTIFNADTTTYGVLYTWLGVFAYTLQIYFDFSGYSDMAIGLGKMFGFEFKKNFNIPYSAHSIQDFWQRWHISLSTWFRDYVYIPLGGNRKGTFFTAVNLLIVFVLCGFWHGANFTFLTWGLFHGFFLIMERITKHPFTQKIPSFIKQLYVWLVVMVGWVLFRSNSIDEALIILKKMCLLIPNTDTMPDIRSYTTPYFIGICIIGCILSTGFIHQQLLKAFKHKRLRFSTYRMMESLMLILLFGWCVMEVISNSYNPFIYYRF